MRSPSNDPGVPLPVLTCRVRDRFCAIPIAHVGETMRPLPVAPIPGAHPLVEGIARVRGRATPVVDAGALLGSAQQAATRRFVLLRLGDRRAGDGPDRQVALAVEAVVAVGWIRSASLQPLPPLLQGPAADTLAGIGTLDRELVLVLAASRMLPAELWASPDPERAA
jgi:purine-binding chemotaxis protein CheW